MLVLITFYSFSVLAPKIEKKSKKCKYFLKGSCRDGDSCSFAHDLPTKIESPVKISKLCSYFIENDCREGESCKYSHQKPLAENICKEFMKGESCSLKGCKSMHCVPPKRGKRELFNNFNGPTSKSSKEICPEFVKQKNCYRLGCKFVHTNRLDQPDQLNQKNQKKPPQESSGSATETSSSLTEKGNPLAVKVKQEREVFGLDDQQTTAQETEKQIGDSVSLLETSKTCQKVIFFFTNFAFYFIC